jgi:hypothetical protein
MRYLVVIIALLFSAQLTQAQVAFEGRVHQTITVPSAPTMKMGTIMNIKGDKLRIDMTMGPAGELKIFTQTGSPTMTSVVERSNTGYEVQIAPLVSEASNTVTGLTSTGKKEKINGFAAEQWTVALDNGTSLELWLSSDLEPSLLKAMSSAMQALDAQDPNALRSSITREIIHKNMAIVRTVIKAQGVEQAIVDLAKIEKTSIPDATFEIPGNVKIVKM